MSGAEPSLKCVVAWSDERNLCALVEAELEATTAAGELMRLGDDAIVIYSGEQPSAIRDAVSGVLRDGESVLVLEFERWSGFGPGIAGEWLLRRGH